MLDLGDELIELFLHNSHRRLRGLQELYRMIKFYEKTKANTFSASGKQLDLLKKLLGEENYQRLDIENLTRNQVSELIEQMSKNNRKTFVFANQDICNDMCSVFDHNHIEYDQAKSLANVIFVDDDAFNTLKTDMDELYQMWAEHDIYLDKLDLDRPALEIDKKVVEELQKDIQARQAREQMQAQVQEQMQSQIQEQMQSQAQDQKTERSEPVHDRLEPQKIPEKDLTARVVEDPIKSHDGMDIDTRTATSETTGYQWKQDLAERVAQAREAAISEEDFKQKCAERGIQLDRATDGEYLYRDAESSWHNVRGDTLGDRFTRNSFEDPSLSSRADTARQASKGLAAERDVPGLEHSVMSR